MTEELPSNWRAPDFLPPDLLVGNHEIFIPPCLLTEVVRRQAKALNQTTNELCRKYIQIGVYAATAEINQNVTMYEIDLAGNRTRVILKEQDQNQINDSDLLMLPPFAPGEKDTGIVYSLSAEHKDILTAIAAYYGITTEEGFKKMLVLGTKIVSHQLLGTKTYCLIDIPERNTLWFTL